MLAGALACVALACVVLMSDFEVRLLLPWKTKLPFSKSLDVTREAPGVLGRWGKGEEGGKEGEGWKG